MSDESDDLGANSLQRRHLSSEGFPVKKRLSHLSTEGAINCHSESAAFFDCYHSEDVIQPPACICGVCIGGIPHIHRKHLSPTHLRHDQGLLLVNMVDFRNPAVIYEDQCACISWHSSSAWAVYLTRLLQGR